jgi:hypothetical protein
VGDTRGFRRTRAGYSGAPTAAKRVFVRPLHGHAQAQLSRPILDPPYRHGAPKIMLSADQMVSLSACFADLPDPRRGQGRRHPLPTVLAIAAGAILCGMRGYQAISRWAQDLSQPARARFRCRYRDHHYRVPSCTVFREVLIRTDPDALSGALLRWNLQYADDEALAIDGKTLCQAIDDDGGQPHVLGVVGHQSQTCYTQKKSVSCP